MMTDEAFLDDVWKRKIEPRLAARSIPVSEPVTVFLGGQPAAGKTRAQRELVRGYSGGLLSIVGDDFRQFHPDYERLCEEDPLAMPDVTALAAGYWTGKAVGYADAHGVSCIIEGTWRNESIVLDEAARARRLKRKTHAVVLAVPPMLSRLGLLARFYDDLVSGEQARWTPPRAHENTVRALPSTVHAVAVSGLFDRLSVMDRSGAFLYDGTDPKHFESIWSDRFTAEPTADERLTVERNLVAIESIRQETGVGLEESEPVIEGIYADLGGRDLTAELEELDDMPPRRVQPREPKGIPRGGRWRR